MGPTGTLLAEMGGSAGRRLRGRSREQAALAAALTAARRGEGTTLVVEGPDGSGRTALVDQVVCCLGPDDLVVRAAGSEAEQLLAYAVLSDLCRPLHQHLDELPEVQRRALRGALALGPPAGDRLAVAAGFLSLLQTAAEAAPLVVVVVDDAHHLDDGSATAVSYAARRLAGTPVLMVVAHAGESSRPVVASEQRITLGPIPHEDALDLVRDVAPGATPAVADALIATCHALPGRLVRACRAAASDPDREAAADLRAALEGSAAVAAPAAGTTVRLLGGLVVERDGRPAAIPSGSVSITIAFVALVRSVHVEQLIEVLWPEIAPGLGRQRVRNVLARVRAAAGPVLHRRGEQILLDREVVVDVHELAAALEVATDPRAGDARRDDARSRALRLYRGALLPELPFEEWAAAERARLAMARVDLLRGLVERMAATGATDEALAVAEQALAEDPDDHDLIVRAAELAFEAGRPSRAQGLLRRAVDRLESLGLPPTARASALADRFERSLRP